MRFLEIALLILACAQVLALLKDDAQRNRLRLGMSLLGLLVLLLHTWIEGARWQLLPVYVLLFLTPLAGYANKRALRIATVVLAGVLVPVSALLAFALPVPELPKTSQPLGTFTKYFVEDDRVEAYGASPGGPRRFVAQFWYPAEPADVEGKEPEPWSRELPRFARAFAASQGLPGFFLDHMSLAKSNAYADVAPAGPSTHRYPVVLYSHGWTGFRTIASNEIERLADAGFIVIAPDHTFGAAGTILPEDEVVLNFGAAMPKNGDPNRQQGIEQLVDTYTGDLKHLLDMLPKLDTGELPSPLKGRIDLERIGVFGHSTGGGAAVELAKSDPRVKALAGLDIWCEPVSPALRSNPREIPVASIQSEDWYARRDEDRLILNEILASCNGPRFDLYLSGSMHADFTMAPLLTPVAHYLLPRQRGTVAAADAVESVDGFLSLFFRQYLQVAEHAPLPLAPNTSHPALRWSEKGPAANVASR